MSWVQRSTVARRLLFLYTSVLLFIAQVLCKNKACIAHHIWCVQHVSICTPSSSTPFWVCQTHLIECGHTVSAHLFWCVLHLFWCELHTHFGVSCTLTLVWIMHLKWIDFRTLLSQYKKLLDITNETVCSY